MPYDLREWIPENDIVHFVIQAAETVCIESFASNERGSGSEQYHPHMLLALLLYCYSQGIFSSRKIELATWKDVAVRYLCGNQHPDHDTLCDFRVRNERAINEAFLKILLLARECGVLKIGMVSVDGTKINANASINKSLRYDRAKALERQLTREIDLLMEKAKEADSSTSDTGDDLGPEIKRLSDLREKMRAAQETLEKQAKERAEHEQKEYEAKRAAKGKPPRKRKGKRDGTPEGTNQVNLTDEDSRIMRKNKRSEYRQCYNPQAVVDAEGSQLVLGTRVTNRLSDNTELERDIDTVLPELGTPDIVLADAGYVSEIPVTNLEKRGIEVLVAVGREYEQTGRTHDFRPPMRKRPSSGRNGPHTLLYLVEMRAKMKTPWAKALYRKRKQTVEPVFGIIKQGMGFRQFLLRGMKKVSLEWRLVACAYNLKRLSNCMVPI
jgi:transposase